LSLADSRFARTNALRAACEHNGPTRRGEPPVAVFLVGATTVAAHARAALAAARRLAGRNVRVVAFVADPDIVAAQLKLFALAGSYFTQWLLPGGVRAVDAHCRHPTIVVDALGSSASGIALPSTAGEAEAVVAWANAANCPRVSLGHPSGFDPVTGARGRTCVDATACCEFTAPTLRCALPPSCQLFLADCGVPLGLLVKAQQPDSAGRPLPSPFFSRPFAALRLDAP